MGRPLKNEKPLEYGIMARVDAQTYDRLINFCNKTGIKKSEVIRSSLEKFLDSEENINKE